MPELPPFVDADWVRDHRRDVLLADVRWRLQGPTGRQEFAREHVAGAVFVDLDDDLAEIGDPLLGRHPLPSPTAFARAMGALGIGDASTVVAYDDAGGLFAARLVWMLRAIGHDAALMDGGMTAWDGPVEAGPGAALKPATFTPTPWPTARLASLDDAARHSGVLIDARTPLRYRGELEPVDPRAGHIPGAVNVPAEDHLAEDGTLRNAAMLVEQFAAVGVTDASGVIASCGSGVNACHTLLVMEHVGLGEGRLFPGSFSAWSNDLLRPVAVGVE